MPSFDAIYRAALQRHGAEELERRLPVTRSPSQLERIPDDRYLSMMTRRVFQAGFNWRVVDHMWPGFEEAFLGFEPAAVAAMQSAQVEALRQDRRIVRNAPKIVATLDNAAFVLEVAAEHGSFGRFIARWPPTDIVGLWQVLKRRGARLGGATAPRFLRSVGKETFILTPDVTACLVAQGVVPKAPTSQRDLRSCQEAFNAWAEESGRSLGELSVIAACSVPG
jgi:3-methyladenine DNA glycosylase Tag